MSKLVIVEIVQTQKSQGSTIGGKNHKVLLLNTEEFNLTKLEDKRGDAHDGLLRIPSPPPLLPSSLSLRWKLPPAETHRIECTATGCEAPIAPTGRYFLQYPCSSAKQKRRSEVCVADETKPLMRSRELLQGAAPRPLVDNLLITFLRFPCLRPPVPLYN